MKIFFLKLIFFVLSINCFIFLESYFHQARSEQITKIKPCDNVNEYFNSNDDTIFRAISDCYFLKNVISDPPNNTILINVKSKMIIFDDKISKNFLQKIENSDVEDMFSQLYITGNCQEKFVFDYDPGRFRNQDFFCALYGHNDIEVKKNLIPVNFCGTSVLFNKLYGAADALTKVSLQLNALMQNDSKFKNFLFPLSGTFVWRKIAGTQRLSPHSWGIAIDINPKQNPYWRWSKKILPLEVESIRSNFPIKLINIFENNGFIWGGKWSHYDMMHFEYRPELLLYSKMLTHSTTHKQR
ncbi:MAG: M15 family metallopeptidase [Pseudomonadota bacterium]